MRHLLNDLRYAARRLAAAPGFTVAAIVTIALGVGINTGIFSVFNGVALRDLPAPDADELVSIHQLFDVQTGRTRARAGTPSSFSTSEYRAYADGTQTLSGIVAYSRQYTVTLGGDSPQEVTGTFVTCNYFDVLRQSPAMGRGFANDCDVEGAAPSVVLGHELWTTTFGADPAVVGREVLLNRQSFVVVGVAPEGVRGLDFLPVQMFTPISTEPSLTPPLDTYREEWSWLILLGRKNAGVSLEQVRAELAVISARIDQQQPPRKTTLSIDRARPLSDPVGRGETVAAGAVLMMAFALVLLIACANVANLLVARATGRTREIAVRLSLGARRGRIVQQLLAESVLIAAAGGALGSLLALWTVQSLVQLAIAALPANAPALAIDATPDGRVLLFAFVVTLGSGVLFGLLPALQASKPDLHAAMKVDVTGTGRSSGRLQAALVGIQVAVCMVLMVSAGLLLRGLQNTQTVDPGFEYDDVAVVYFNLAAAGYDAPRVAAFQAQLIERVSTLPGIDDVAQASLAPLAPGSRGVTGRPAGTEQWRPIRINQVSPNYFSLTAMPIVRGRTFTDAEHAAGGAIVVTESTARSLWPDRDPIGQTLQWALSNIFSAEPVQTLDLQVVGVAKDAQITAIGEVPSNYVYFSAGQMPLPLQLTVKSAMDFAATARGIRAAAAELDPALVVRVAPLEENLDYYRRLSGLVSTLATTLGTLALVLASVGVYGVVAYAVGRRTREIGIRIALGASAPSVLALMLRRTMRPVVIGAVLGVVLAMGASRVLSSVLFGVSPADPIALIAAAFVVTAVAFAAGALPARRAARVDPTRTLHYE
jgi:putative ABC transport system permease protein